MAVLLKDNPALKVNVEGHTDNTGKPSKNKTLSQQRADAVKSAVVKQGVSADRMTTKGWGQDKPLADNRTEEGRTKNRRVEIVKK
jgi:outer membrane protein OmpA-like peptidoglycan-associated protein